MTSVMNYHLHMVNASLSQNCSFLTLKAWKHYVSIKFFLPLNGIIVSLGFNVLQDTKYSVTLVNEPCQDEALL